MKKMIIVILLALVITTVNAQKMSDVIQGDVKITFLGLDFTNAKFIGSTGFTDPYKIGTYYFGVWNEILVSEYDKYNIKDALRSRNYETNTEVLTIFNDGYDVEANLINGTYSITEKEVQKSVRKYKLKEKEGIGVSYVVESFDKTQEKAVVWVTFIDMSSKKVLYTEKLEGDAGGFGFRNYWLGAIYKVNKQVKSRYKVWKKKFK